MLAKGPILSPPPLGAQHSVQTYVDGPQAVLVLTATALAQGA